MKRNREIPNRQDYVKFTDGENTLEFKPVGYEFDYSDTGDEIDNNWLDVNFLAYYENKKYNKTTAALLVDEIQEMIDEFSKLLTAESDRYVTTFVEPDLDMIFERKEKNYKANIYYWHDTDKLLNMKLTLSRADLETVIAKLKNIYAQYPLR